MRDTLSKTLELEVIYLESMGYGKYSKLIIMYMQNIVLFYINPKTSYCSFEYVSKLLLCLTNLIRRNIKAIFEVS